MSAEPTGAAHVVEDRHFRAIARGHGDSQAIAFFRASERSWRLLALAGLAQACENVADPTGPLAPLDTAWQLLTRAEATDPIATDDVLTYPPVGVWAAYTVKRALGLVTGSAPLWTDVGYLHALAAACAARAGLDFAIDIPVRHGIAVLPTLGAASVAGRTEYVTVHSDGRRVAIGHGVDAVTAEAEDPRWHEPVRIRVEAGGIALSVALENHDPFRDLADPAPPRPLSEGGIARWRLLLAGSWRLLVREQPERARSIAADLRVLVPAGRREPYRQFSASGSEAFGGVLLSEPDDATQMAVTLVHETQHHKLGALLHLLTLMTEDAGRRYYAPWRDDPRPLPGLLQGTYAFTGITDFWRVHRARGGDSVGLAHFEFALRRQQALAAAVVLAGSGRLSDHGRRFVETLRRELAAYQAEPVPPDALDLAEDMAIDHSALWRAHNMRLDSTLADNLEAAWHRREPASAAIGSGAPPAVAGKPPIGRLDSRSVLARHRLADSSRFDRLRQAADRVGSRVAGARPADLALIAGEAEAARASYLRELRHDRTTSRAWVGLGLTLDRSGPAARALLGRPELVVALARRLAEVPDPVEMATWIGHGLPDGLIGRPEPAGWRVV